MLLTQAAKIVQKSILKMKLICHFIEIATISVFIGTSEQLNLPQLQVLIITLNILKLSTLFVYQ